MSELGDLLAVVHGAHRSFGSVRLGAREWRHNHRLHAAYARAAERAGAATYALGGEEVPAESEVLVRAWFEQPNRVREEREEAGHLAGRGWRSHVLYTPGHEGTRVRETVHLAFYRDDASHSVSLRQTAGPWESWQTNGTEEAARGGRSLRVSVGPWHRVLMEERGTFVELDSQTVETEALVELALALEPAPAEPPPLVS